MKKIYKNGFTLVELLAVVVILSIIAIIATATIFNSASNASKESFIQSADNIADFIKKQNQFYIADSGGKYNEECYINYILPLINKNDKNLFIRFGENNKQDSISECLGINTTDYDVSSSFFKLNNNNTVEIFMQAEDKGKFENVKIDNNTYSHLAEPYDLDGKSYSIDNKTIVEIGGFKYAYVKK